MKYNPDLWALLEIKSDGQLVYKILGSWYGNGYLGSDSWRLNSGIASVYLNKDKTEYHVHGYSSSVYICPVKRYGMSGYSSSIVTQMVAVNPEATITVLPESEARTYLDDLVRRVGSG